MTAAAVRRLAYATILILLALGGVGLQRDLGCAMARTAAVGSTPAAGGPPLPPPAQAQMRLVAGQVTTARPFRVFCIVRSKLPGQPVLLVVPDGLELMPDSASIQFTPPKWPGNCVKLTWRLRALRTGSYELQAVAPGYAETTLNLTCGFSCIFD